MRRTRRRTTSPGSTDSRGHRREPTLSPARRRLFTAIALAIPCVFLLALEGGLRLGGYGGEYPLFVAYPPQPEYLYPNPEIARRYFRDRTITPVPQLDFFRAEKTPRTFRIVFQGESSAAGFPYRHGGAPSRMLEQRLQATFPDRDIEVINTALTAVNSYALLDLADEIIAQRPDAVMIYTGHNEYYGVFGVGSTRSVGRWRPLVRAYLALRRLRTVQLLENALSAVSRWNRRGDAAPAAGTVMELLAGNQTIPLDSPRYRQGLDQFRANLGELLSRYQANGIRVLIGTVASNERDQKPFVGQPSGARAAAARRSFQVGRAALQHGDSAAAERAFEEAARTDDTAADAYYALATILDARGDFPRARACYREAKERDRLRFRAPEAINRIIRGEAARYGASVVETERALERASPHGIVGRSVMLEHLHPNLDGYFLIADAFYEALRREQMIGEWTRAVPAADARREIPVTAVDSLAGLLRTDRLLSGYPFRPAGSRVTPVMDTLHPSTPVEQLALGLARGSMNWPEAMERQRELYERLGEYDRALGVARAMALEFRYAAGPYMDEGRIAIAQGRYAEAAQYIRAAVERRPTPKNIQLLGLLLLRQGDQAGAVANLERASQLAPGDQRMVITLTAAQAIPRLEHDRDVAPRDTRILYNLAAAYALTQQYEKARGAIATLLRLDPAHAGARALLRRLPAEGPAARGAPEN